MKTRVLVLIFSLMAMASMAQEKTSIYNPTDVFDPLINFHPSTVYRSAAGRPGPQYWQNQANYAIKAALGPENQTEKGTVEITYINNSPDPLDFLWLQLDQNRFTQESRGSKATPMSVGRYGLKNFEGGYNINNVQANKIGKKGKSGPSLLKETVISDTRMQVFLSSPLKTSEKAVVTMDFEFKIPPNGSDRCGIYNAKDGKIFEIAQWYPRMCVYDDLEGWNTSPYLGAGEFYLEYGNTECEITVPYKHVVVGTGELINPQEVLSKGVYSKLKAASASDKTLMIISKEDLEKDETYNKKSGLNTWKFKCENTRDVAFAVSDIFVWDAARAVLPSGKSILVQSVYPAENGGEAAWGRSTEYTKHSMEFYSKTLFEFPYPAATNVGGIVSGMEYPGIVFCSAKSDGQELFDVTDHEFGHTWFPMIVGSNERKFAWMDEGFNTYINGLSTKAFNNGEYYKPQKTQQLAGLMRMQKPILASPDAITEFELGTLAYFKPAIGLKMLGEAVVGEDRLNFAMKEYINRWAFKHPSPFDFFHSMEDVLGEDLGWFWKSWFINSYKLDQSVKEVRYRNGRAADGAIISIENMEQMPMPAEVSIKEKDKEPVTVKLPVEVWMKNKVWTFHYPSTTELEKVSLDPRGVLPDVNQSNNSWKPNP
ncbi:MAG: M1 family metallopeptidase [Cytophagaceae bacterium]|nr:M1 family metallopeptidase [Cytophagaceae bacterium]